MAAKLTDVQIEQIELSSNDVIEKIEANPEQLNQAFLIAEIEKISKLFDENTYLVKMGKVIKVWIPILYRIIYTSLQKLHRYFKCWYCLFQKDLMLDNMMRKRTGVLLFSNMISNPETLHRAICQHEEQLQKFFPADDLYWVKKSVY